MIPIIKGNFVDDFIEGCKAFDLWSGESIYHNADGKIRICIEGPLSDLIFRGEMKFLHLKNISNSRVRDWVVENDAWMLETAKTDMELEMEESAEFRSVGRRAILDSSDFDDYSEFEKLEVQEEAERLKELLLECRVKESVVTKYFYELFEVYNMKVELYEYWLVLSPQ